ncbi:hypothetical protein HDU98_005883 [Podochytrium sp. JEL0797]|nr:hypothetical protein HDU98_005883 [Podochytrium sp. JEL0797]
MSNSSTINVALMKLNQNLPLLHVAVSTIASFTVFYEIGKIKRLANEQSPFLTPANLLLQLMSVVAPLYFITMHFCTFDCNPLPYGVLMVLLLLLEVLYSRFSWIRSESIIRRQTTPFIFSFFKLLLNFSNAVCATPLVLILLLQNTTNIFIIISIILSAGSILILDVFYATSFYRHIKSLSSTSVEPKLRIIAVYGLWSCCFALATFTITGFAFSIRMWDPELKNPTRLILFVVSWIVKDFLFEGVGWALLLMRVALTRCDAEGAVSQGEDGVKCEEGLDAVLINIGLKLPLFHVAMNTVTSILCFYQIGKIKKLENAPSPFLTPANILLLLMSAISPFYYIALYFYTLLNTALTFSVLMVLLLFLEIIYSRFSWIRSESIIRRQTTPFSFKAFQYLLNFSNVVCVAPLVLILITRNTTNIFVILSIILSAGSILTLDAFYATSFYRHIKSLSGLSVPDPKLRIIAVYGLWSCCFALATFAVAGFAFSILVMDPELQHPTSLRLFVVFWILKDFLFQGIEWALLVMRIDLTRCDEAGVAEGDVVKRGEGVSQTTDPQTRNTTQFPHAKKETFNPKMK